MLNSSPFETHTFRVQTGGAYNIIGAYGQMVSGSSFPTKGAIPIPTGKSGTIISTGKRVRGTGTLFTRELVAGDFLYHKEVVRRIDFIESDTMLTLTQAFPTDIASAEIPLLCPQQQYTSIYAKNTATSGDAKIQESPITPSNTFLNQGSPVSYDATAGELEFTVTK